MKPLLIALGSVVAALALAAWLRALALRDVLSNPFDIEDDIQ